MLVGLEFAWKYTRKKDEADLGRTLSQIYAEGVAWL